MKRTISIILLICSMFFVSCGNPNDRTSKLPVGNESSNSKDEKSRDELNEQLKSECIKADFISLNGNTEQNKNLKVFVEGEISVVDYDSVMDLFPSFMISQKEGEGYGMYHITNVLSIPDLKDGDYVKIYGTVDGTNNVGIPKIVSTVIEKNF